MTKETLNKIGLFLIGLILGLILLSHCSDTISKPIIDKTDSLTNANYKLLDSVSVLNDSITRLDTTRHHIITKYRYLKGLTDTIPCDSLILRVVEVCDTIIEVDSLEIMTLKQINRNFVKVIQNDSTIIAKKNHAIDSISKSKKKYWFGFKHGFLTGTVLTGAGVGALILTK